MEEFEFHRQLKLVRRRLQRFRELDGMRWGFLSGLAAALLWLAAGRLWPLEGPWMYAAASIGVFTAAGWLYGRFNWVPLAEAARTMDRAEPGEERQDLLATAFAFAGEDSPAARQQRGQAEAYGAAYIGELKQRLPLPRRRYWPLAAAAGLLAVLLLAVLPNPMDETVRKNRQARDWVRTQQTETERKLEQLKAETLDPQAKTALSDELAELRQALRQSRNPDQALDLLEEKMRKLDEMADKLELEQRRREDWLEAWKSRADTGKLGKALEMKSPDEAGKAVDELRQKAPSLTVEQRESLAEALRQLAETAPDEDADAQRLGEALRKAAAALESGEAAGADRALEELAEAMERDIRASETKSGQAASASELAAALAEQGLDLAEDMAASGLAVSGAWGQGGRAEQLAAGSAASGSGASPGNAPGENAPGGRGTGEGNGPGDGSGAGAGQRSGGGSGIGQGQGSGAGSGTGGRGQGIGAGQGQGSGAGLGSGGRTLVTTPRSIQGGGRVETDGGPATGGSVQKGGKSPVLDGVSRPYEEVYSDYAAEAKRSLERKDLPQRMQGLVERYFTEIDPGS
ncbi:phage tail tape measure protein [Paenibacillus sp. alder61]|uniref:Phage tail tape measure protein n=1 Tax=Paenibacillus faecis TaxID=862114 RepID=A0A5D0D1X2_9BACL|nr:MULTISPECIES: phage tail tape measure protein [Paenibacillus]MCA1294411.1 phage tail tape measure protein [Paenibacillus sp. alder61]TYA15157.1 phage tail tape measure protein [Paenibacillus faecis]